MPVTVVERVSGVRTSGAGALLSALFGAVGVVALQHRHPVEVAHGRHGESRVGGVGLEGDADQAEQQVDVGVAVEMDGDPA